MNTAMESNEKQVGWLLHYSIGIVFAFIFILIVTERWFVELDGIKPIVFGLITTLFPYLILQPCFRFGFFCIKVTKTNVGLL